MSKTVIAMLTIAIFIFGIGTALMLMGKPTIGTVCCAVTCILCLAANLVMNHRR